MFLGESKPLIINTGQDLSSASAVEILNVDPSGNKGNFDADVYETNYLKAELTSTNIDEAGTWTVQGKITFSTGTFYTEIETFQVYGTIEE